MARKHHEPTEESRAHVRELRRSGVPKAKIARELGIKFKTLNREYADELGEIAEEVKAAAVAAQGDLAELTRRRYQQIVAGDPEAPPLQKGESSLVIFGLKAFCGCKETVPVGSGERDVAQSARDLSDDELASVVGDRARIRAGAPRAA